MSEITVRTAYFQEFGGVIRFYDWAKINYPGVGTCAEPFFPNHFIRQGSEADRSNLDYSTDMIKINYLVPCDFGKLEQTAFGDGVKQLHGGTMYPRKGR